MELVVLTSTGPEITWSCCYLGNVNGSMGVEVEGGDVRGAKPGETVEGYEEWGKVGRKI